MKNVSSYNNREVLAENCIKVFEIRFEGEIPMPKNNSKIKKLKKEKSKNYPDFF